MQDVVVRNGKKKLNVVVRSHEIDHTARPCLDGLGFEILKFALILTCIMCSLKSMVMFVKDTPLGETEEINQLYFKECG